MRTKLAMMLAAIGMAVTLSSAPASANPMMGAAAADASRAAAGAGVVEEVGRKHHRKWRRYGHRPRVYGFYGRPYYRRHFYRPYYYRPYYYGGYPYYYRRRPGIYFGFGF